MATKKRCFVVMGFGIKTDLATGRKLNLDNAYRNMIKPAIEQCGLECVRADEIPHSGNIDVQMYRELLTADVVVADISTANCNAIYELGVRHALRPWTTVVISEDRLEYPFDLNHIVITPYKQMGDDIFVGDALRLLATRFAGIPTSIMVTTTTGWLAILASLPRAHFHRLRVRLQGPVSFDPLHRHPHSD